MIINWQIKIKFKKKKRKEESKRGREKRWRTLKTHREQWPSPDLENKGINA